MEASDYISAVALVIASLAALYARWSARAAEKSNSISLHSTKLEIYLELRKFQKCFKGYQAYPDENSIDIFYEKSVVLSEIFFDPETASEFNDVYDSCWQKSRQINGYENEEGEDEFHSEMKIEFNEICGSQVESLSNKLRESLRINA